MAEHQIPESLIDKIRTGRAALVVGASIGVLAGQPTWRQLLAKLKDELAGRLPADEATASKLEAINELIIGGRLGSAAAYLARVLGGATCDAMIAETWVTPEKLPAPVRLLGSLPIKSIWSTHPGDLVEKAVAAGSPESWPEARVASYEDAGKLDTRRRHVLKLLGDVNRPESYVVLPASVRRAVSTASAYRGILQDTYREGSLVFVGFRWGDPDLTVLLDRILSSFEPPDGMQHYFVGTGLGPLDAEELRAEHHMSVVPIDERRGEDAIAGFLGALAVACEKAELTLHTSRPAEDDLEGWLALLAQGGSEADVAEARDAVSAIERRARASGQSDRVVEILLARVEQEAEPAARARLLRDVAHLYEVDIGDLPRAFTALTTALQENPADEEVVAEAERLAAETDGWGELVADLAEIVPHIEDKKVAAGHWVRLGRWYQDKLHHNDYALASYREALKRDPGSVPAYVGLEELYRRQQRWGDLAESLADHAEVETDAAKRVEVLLALGDLNETQAGATAKAIDAYEKVLATDAGNDDALGALERLYRRGERWGRLTAVLEKRAELFEKVDPARAASYRRELGALRSDKLGDVEGAIGRWEAALATNERDVEALKALEKLYEKVGRTEDYLRTLERIAEFGPESERAATWRRLAAEVEDREGGVGRAARYYEQVLGLEPNALDAYRTLERLYRASQSWDALVRLYERHLSVVQTPAQRVELWASLGRLYEGELADPHRALEAYLNVADIQADHHESMTALIRLYKRIESWERAVSTIEKLAERDRSADLWHDAGQVLARNLGDEAAAAVRFAKALELEPGHLPSLRALTEQARKKQDFARATQLMLEAEPYTPNRIERIGLLYDAGFLFEERLEQHDKAADLYLRVLALDPEHVEAGLRLAERWVAAGRWADAEPVLEMLARKVDPEDRVEKARRETLLGRASDELGKPDKAAKHYAIAVETDKDSLEAALGLAGLQYARKEWAIADKSYREVLARHRPALAQGQVVDIWYRIGVAARSRGEAKSAADAFRRALEQDPGHRSALGQVVELAAERGDWKTVVEAKRDGLEGSTEAERARLLEEIGDVTAQKLNDPLTALGVYLEALKLRPRSHVLLHKLLEIYTERKEWRQALGTLDKLVEQEKDAGLRSKYMYTAAVIARDELEDLDEAVERLNKALDDAPGLPKAFEAIQRILEDKKDWKGLARACRQMIKRQGERATPAQLLHLWTTLGDVAAKKLHDRDAALVAYEAASALEPQNMERHELLAELYLSAGPERADKAVGELQVLLRRYPDRLDLYRSLSDLYVKTGQRDKAFCLAQALMFLGQATDEEKKLVEESRPKQLVLAKRRLTEELWQKAIIHPREDRALNGIFSSLMASFAAVTAQPHQALSLNPKEQTDLERDPHPVARLFRYAAQTLGLSPMPELYLSSGARDGIRTANVAEKGVLMPAVLIGEPHVAKRAEGEIVFDVGKKLAFLRPERYVYYALPTLPKLEAALEAALVVAGLAPARKEPEVERLTTHLKKTVPEPILEHVAALGRKLVGAGSIPPPSNGSAAGSPPPVPAAVGGWMTATDLTANRVGLILANDLETAARMIATEQGAPTTLSAKERLRELLAYAASEEYFSVRRHLGLDVGGGS